MNALMNFEINETNESDSPLEKKIEIHDRIS